MRPGKERRALRMPYLFSSMDFPKKPVTRLIFRSIQMSLNIESLTGSRKHRELSLKKVAVSPKPWVKANLGYFESHSSPPRCMNSNKLHRNPVIITLQSSPSP
ncbi:hypothetical protein TNCV_4480931 [Trichonephila clavipes]|nr:hypothetical protein TNCV_4480931 [Trichonephila clavipes]